MMPIMSKRWFWLFLRLLVTASVVVLSAIWASSWFRHYYIAIVHGHLGVTLTVAHGELRFVQQDGLLDFSSKVEIINPAEVVHILTPSPPLSRHLGIGWDERVYKRSIFLPDTYTRRLTLPAWIVVAPGILWMTLIALRKFKLRSRAARVTGRCQRCGYDLRMSPNLCPECGLAVPTATAPKDVAGDGEPKARMADQ